MLRKLLTVGVVATAASQAPAALYLHDPMAYTPGQTLEAQTAPSGQTWDNRGSTADDPIIQEFANFGGAPANLTYPHFPSSGNGVAYGGAGDSAAVELEPAANFTAGTFYYSFLMRVNALGGLGAGGAFFAAFNNTSGDNTAAVTTAAGRLLARANGAGGYNLGIERSSGSGANFLFAPNQFSVGETVFAVVSYEFVSGTGNDMVKLWINPDDLADEATPDVSFPSTGTGSDLAAIQSFIFRQGAGTQPGDMNADELRLGDTWAEVAPVPEPSVLALAAMGAVGFMFRRSRRPERV